MCVCVCVCACVCVCVICVHIWCVCVCVCVCVICVHIWCVCVCQNGGSLKNRTQRETAEGGFRVAFGGRRTVSLTGEVDEIVTVRGLPELTAFKTTTVEVRYANSTAVYGTEGEIDQGEVSGC